MGVFLCFWMELQEWCEIFEVLRDTCIDDVKILRGTGIEVGNPTTYGEITPKFIHQILNEIEITADDVFYDVGSGIGNVVLQVAAQIGCICHGIEIRPELSKIAIRMQNKLSQLSKTRTKKPVDIPEIYFHTGDALGDQFDFSDATIIFVNNWCFAGELEHDLFVKFQKILPAGTKIICLKDAFPRFRPNSLRCDDLPCHRFRYPWRKFESCDDAISWDSRLVECVVYQVYDSICSLPQANSLIHSLTISDCAFSETPKPRAMFVDEARAFLTPVLIENFETNDIIWRGTIEDNVEVIIDKMRNQRFTSTFAHLRKQPHGDKLNIRRRQLKVNTFSVIPSFIEIALRESDKIGPIGDTTIISEEDFNKSYEEQKKLHENASKPIPHLFLRRNFGDLSERKNARPLNFTFGRRPFAVEENEHEEFLIRIKPRRTRTTLPVPFSPQLIEGKHPNWIAKPKPAPPAPIKPKKRKKEKKRNKQTLSDSPLPMDTPHILEFPKFPPVVPPRFGSFPAAAANPNPLLLTRSSLRAMKDAALFMHIPPPAPAPISKTIKKKPTTKLPKPKAQNKQNKQILKTPKQTKPIVPKNTKKWVKKLGSGNKSSQSNSSDGPVVKRGRGRPRKQKQEETHSKSIPDSNGIEILECTVLDSKISTTTPPIFLKRTLSLAGKKRNSLPASTKKTSASRNLGDEDSYVPPTKVSKTLTP